MKTGPYVHFKPLATDKAKLTKIWNVQTVQGERIIGIVKWWPAWRRYCFFPLPDMLFDANCL